MSVRGIRKSGNIIHVLPGLRFRFLYISFKCNDPPLIRNVEKGIMVTSKKATTFVIAFCDPVGIRTQDLRLRRPLLYPAELPNRVSFIFDGAKIAVYRINTNFGKHFFSLN